jgi:hypothetical protein
MSPSNGTTMVASLVTVVVWSALHTFQGRWQCVPRHSFENTLTCWHWLLSQLFEVMPQDLRESWEGLYKHDTLGVPTEKNPLDQATKEVLQLTLDVQSTFLDMSHSSTAWHLPHTALELCSVETTTLASQLDVHLWEALVKQFLTNLTLSSLSGRRQAQDNVPDDSSPNADTSRLDTHVHG